MAKISKDTPLSEITLRKYGKPGKLTERELVRKICLSLGLLQPGDSRDVIVDIFHILIKSSKNQKSLDSKEIEDKVIAARKKYNMPLLGIASSNIRRQLKRLKDLFIIESNANRYRINEFEELETIFEEKIEQYYLKSIISRIKEYLASIR